MDLSQYLFESSYALELENQGHNIIVIGAGGNGSYLIPHLARMVNQHNQEISLFQDENRLTLVDADRVEPHNLGRQHFIEPDVGRNKAEVLAQRYGAAYGMPIHYKAEYLEDKEALDALVRQDNKPTIIVGCVDNNKTRMMVHDLFRNNQYTHKMYSLDLGNEEWAGQVVMGYQPAQMMNDFIDASEDLRKEMYKNEENKGRLPIPDMPEFFGGNLEVTSNDDQFPSMQSCGENAVSAPQNIFTNQTMAHIGLGFLAPFFRSNNVDNNTRKIEQFVVFANTMPLNMTTYLNKPSILAMQGAAMSLSRRTAFDRFTEMAMASGEMDGDDDFEDDDD